MKLILFLLLLALIKVVAAALQTRTPILLLHRHTPKGKGTARFFDRQIDPKVDLPVRLHKW